MTASHHRTTATTTATTTGHSLRPLVSSLLSMRAADRILAAVATTASTPSADRLSVADHPAQPALFTLASLAVPVAPAGVTVDPARARRVGAVLCTAAGRRGLASAGDRTA